MTVKEFRVFLNAGGGFVRYQGNIIEVRPHPRKPHSIRKAIAPGWQRGIYTNVFLHSRIKQFTLCPEGPDHVKATP